ncbi:MAG: flagellar hook assembly protein FlgD [Bacteriovoracaceae bacterium]|nr:flagellar hook assembly protein FlgD [Bacteriovoracaceae bacterium]
MPGIGVPKNFKANPFSKVALHKGQKSAKQLSKKESKQQLLNRLTGKNTEGFKYVDQKTHNKMGKDDFMKLLATQLKNQDPSNPMDQRKFASELAQFSQLEQLANINTKMTQQGENVGVERKYYGASFLGKEVTTAGTTVDYKGRGDRVDIPFFLPKNAKNLLVRIFDNKGQLVKQIEKANMFKGSQSIIWDGKRADKVDAAKGTYTVQVKAWDESAAQFDGQTKSKGIVTSVQFKDGEAVLQIDGKKSVFLRDVETFRLPWHNGHKGKEMAKQLAVDKYKGIAQ